MDTGPAYLHTRDRFVEVVAGADLSAAVPATPGWTVGDLLRHVVGVAADVAVGDTDAYAQPGWTAAQVEARAGTGLDALLDEWSTVAQPLAAILDDPQGHGRDSMYGRAPFIDLVLHEQDLRYALGVPIDPQEQMLRFLMEGRVALFALQVSTSPAPTLELRTVEGVSWTVGDGAPGASVQTDALALFRSLHGRRTRDQVRAFVWDGDAEPYLDMWPGWVFSFPEHAVEDATR